MSTSPDWTFRKAIAPSLAAIKHTWPSLILIQAGAAALVIFYYRSAALQDWAVHVAQLKVNGGIVFSFIAGALAGGALPELTKAITGRLGPKGERLTMALFNGLVYGIVGSQVDLFYRLQTWLFGAGIDPTTLAIKVAFDMSCFSTIISIPTAVYLYEWRAGGYKWSVLRPKFTLDFYKRKIVPALFPCWAFWIPTLVAVYAMPPNLQFPVSILAEAAWSLLFVFLATQEPDLVEAPSAP